MISVILLPHLKYTKTEILNVDYMETSRRETAHFKLGGLIYWISLGQKYVNVMVFTGKVTYV